VVLIWHGDKVATDLRKESRAVVLDSVVLIERLIKMSMRRGGRTETGDHQKGQKVSKINTFRSKVGEVPRVQTGTLRRSITHWMNPMFNIGRVGTNVKYGKFLELGTNKILPRPFIRPALDRARRTIEAMFATRLGRAFGGHTS